METAAARVEPEILDAIQTARGRVPIEEFRLLVNECQGCQIAADLPATEEYNVVVRQHIRTAHGDLVV
jgi:hypothetical protein